MYTIGACICDKQFQGYQCQLASPIDKANQCDPNSAQPACNPQTSICRTSEFFLTNLIQKPEQKTNNYKTYYCECTKPGTVGLNCEFDKNPCQTTSRLYSKSKRQLGSLTNQSRCDTKNGEICLLMANTTEGFKCIQTKTTPVVNYLVFDQSNKNPNFDANKPGDNKKLNLTDPGIIMGIQNFLRDEVLPRYSYNNYAKIPKGPLAILRPSVNLPDILNQVRDKVNNFVNSNSALVNDILDRFNSNRVKQIVQDNILNIITNQKWPINVPIEDLKVLTDKLVEKLNISPLKLFNSDLWQLIPTKFDSNLTNGDPTGIINNLNTLKDNSDKINNQNSLKDILTLSTDNRPFINFFNFSNKPYRLLKLDILPGIYVDSDGELSVRPTPGLFLESIPQNETSLDRDVLFLPGIFNSASSTDCSIRTIFTPGIMSLPIDSYDLANIPTDSSKYLNKFMPVQLPFNINGFLNPLKSSASDTVLSLIQNNKINSFTYLLLTPLDINPDANFDLITKNDKFMSNLFSSDGLNKVIKEQKQLDIPNLSSTLLLSDPTMLPLSKQTSWNEKCLNPDPNKPPRFSPKGGQFFTPTNPADNVTVLPFVFYDDNGNPIPESIIRQAIEKYCRNFQIQLSEFHARICDALNQTKKIIEASQQSVNSCPNCTFTILADRYYNPLNITPILNTTTINPSLITTTPKSKPNLLLLAILLPSILGPLLLLALLSLLCYCCPCCPLAACLAKRKKNKFKVILNLDLFELN